MAGITVAEMEQDLDIVGDAVCQADDNLAEGLLHLLLGLAVARRLIAGEAREHGRCDVELNGKLVMRDGSGELVDLEQHGIVEEPVDRDMKVVLLAENGEVRVTKYWDMRYDLGPDTNEDKLSQGLEQVVQRSVVAHCKSSEFDSIGAFLSGGTDSSTVVGMMSRTGRGPVR